MIDRRPTVASSETTLAWSDPAAQWGLGIFETIAVREGDPRFVDEHLARLTSAATHLSIPLPDKKEIEKTLAQLAHKIESGHGWLGDVPAATRRTRTVSCRPCSSRAVCTASILWPGSRASRPRRRSSVSRKRGARVRTRGSGSTTAVTLRKRARGTCSS